MEHLALLTQKAGTNGKIVFDIGYRVLLLVRKRVTVVGMAAVELYAALHPLVEALVKLYGEGVLDEDMVGAIGSRVSGKEEVAEVPGVVDIVAFTRLETAYTVVETEGMDERGDGNELSEDGQRIGCSLRADQQ